MTPRPSWLIEVPSIRGIDVQLKNPEATPRRRKEEKFKHTQRSAYEAVPRLTTKRTRNRLIAAWLLPGCCLVAA